MSRIPLEALAPFLKRLGTLAQVLPWGVAQRPQWIVADVVIQDEFTHDIILTAEGEPQAIILDCT